MTDDVLLRLRTATAEDHERVERALDLMDGSLDRLRLVRAMTVLHGFWRAAEAGLDAWAAAHPVDADRLLWPTRRRADLYAGDLRALGSAPAEAAPSLPALRGTDDALGRMYVLEGSTLGGTFIDRHLAGLPDLSGVRLHAFSPYGERTGAMWAAYRRATREHVASGGDPDRVVDAACDTFGALSEWVMGGSVVHCARGSSDLWTSR
jgi:heme oxygenase (biliverdin-IX-beta and delta-forming)